MISKDTLLKLFVAIVSLTIVFHMVFYTEIEKTTNIYQVITILITLIIAHYINTTVERKKYFREYIMRKMEKIDQDINDHVRADIMRGIVKLSEAASYCKNTSIETKKLAAMLKKHRETVKISAEILDIHKKIQEIRKMITDTPRRTSTAEDAIEVRENIVYIKNKRIDKIRKKYDDIDDNIKRIQDILLFE